MKIGSRLPKPIIYFMPVHAGNAMLVKKESNILSGDVLAEVYLGDKTRKIILEKLIIPETYFFLKTSKQT